MVILSRFLSFLALFFGLLTWIKFPPGLIGGIIWLPKLWASAWSPVFAAVGLIGAGLGLAASDALAAVAGMIAAGIDLRHIYKVTRPHNRFTKAFGSNWLERIPPEVKARLMPSRYRLVQPAPPAVPGQRDVKINHSGNPEDDLPCDIWFPPDRIPHTGVAIIYFHGGAWQAFDKDFLTQPLFRHLANQGHVIMDVAYSLAPRADLNRMLGEVKQAIVWMKNHAAEYKVNPDHIVLMGVSGGAHLALMGAYAPDHPAFQRIHPDANMAVRGVISIFGITDMAAFFVEYGRSTRKQPEYSTQITDDLLPRVFNRSWVDNFMTRSRAFPAYRYGNMPGGALLLVNLLGGTLKEIPEVYRQASPITHVGKHCPPTLSIYAGNDFLIDTSHGRRLHRALCDAGVPSIYLEFPESVHGFDQYFLVSRRIAPAAQSQTYDIERFLAMLIE